MKSRIYIIIVLVLVTANAYAQKERKVTFTGGARSIMTNSKLGVTDTLATDTSTAKRTTGGYALIDLGVNIKPNKNTEILGMFRIRNGYGGFWGSAVTFDVRQLYMKGVVANALRYQLGDLNLKQTPFTLFNHHADVIDSLPDIFNMQRNIVNYEKFYMNNTWRMQGANVDFGLSFRKYIKEININAFTNRLNATNFSNVPERLMSGATIEMVQSKYFRLAWNANYIYDVLGTIKDTNTFHNNINSIDASFNKTMGNQHIKFATEVGKSKYNYSADTLAPILKDYFAHAYASVEFKKQNIKATLGYLNVGPQYRSIGAQSKDINYQALPISFDRYTNAQTLRPLGLLDAITNENIYNRTVTSKLMQENSLFNNALPYGIATFNRVGLYGQVQYNNHIQAQISYHNLKEIIGQGTLALRTFTIVKGTVKVPLHYYLKTKNKLECQVGFNTQNIARTSNVSLEDMSLKNTNYNLGFTYELFKNFDLLGGYINQKTSGNDFIAERNNFSEITFYTNQNYAVTQSISAGGVRYNFTPKIYLSGLYQHNAFKDALHKQADFKINQFNIIYNMLF